MLQTRLRQCRTANVSIYPLTSLTSGSLEVVSITSISPLNLYNMDFNTEYMACAYPS